MSYFTPSIFLSTAILLGCAPSSTQQVPASTSHDIAPEKSQQDKQKSSRYGARLLGEVAARKTLKSPKALGISGSCKMKGTTYLVAERNQTLFRSTQDGFETLPIVGVPAGLDLEGLACINDTFYISTEVDEDGRTSDLVLVAAISNGELHIQEKLSLAYPSGMIADKNHGLEGLCIAGDWLVAAAELIRESPRGVRQAPLLKVKLGSDVAPSLHWVNLTSSSGKLSGIDCRMSGEAVEVFAIERHFKIARILHFELGVSPAESKTVLSLEALVQESENFEALLVDDQGTATLHNDNQYATITGPSEEVTLKPVSEFIRLSH